jgi:hypothetical protein
MRLADELAALTVVASVALVSAWIAVRFELLPERTPAFAVTSNLCFLVPAAVSAVRWDRSPVALLVAAACLRLSVCSAAWHVRVLRSPIEFMAADVVCMACVSVALAALAAEQFLIVVIPRSAPAPSVVAMVIIAASIAATPLLMRTKASPSNATLVLATAWGFAIVLFAAAEVVRAVRVDERETWYALGGDAIAALVGPLWTAGLHVRVALPRLAKCRPHNRSGSRAEWYVCSLARYDAICGTFHSAAALAIIVGVDISTRERGVVQNVAQGLSTLVVGATTTGTFVLVLLCLHRRDVAWSATCMPVLFGTCVLVWTASTVATAATVT